MNPSNVDDYAHHNLQEPSHDEQDLSQMTMAEVKFIFFMLSAALAVSAVDKGEAHYVTAGATLPHLCLRLV